MGTRGAMGVKINDTYKVMYNHFDSYPDGLGTEMVNFCIKMNAENGWEKFAKMMKKVKLVGEGSKPSESIQQKYMKNGFYDKNVSGQSPTDWYCLLRNLQMAKIFEAIYNGDCKHMIDGLDFLKDSLFCEYAYIINLDTKSLDFYRGFNEKPDEKSNLPFKQETSDRQDKYYPVRYLGSIPLSELTRESWMEKIFPKEK